MLATAIDEVVDTSWELILDAPEVNPHRHQLTPILPPKPLGLEIDPSDDDDDAIGPSS
jgi:hypothetical protein